jgi:hypothetical protein
MLRLKTPPNMRRHPLMDDDRRNYIDTCAGAVDIDCFAGSTAG